MEPCISANCAVVLNDGNTTRFFFVSEFPNYILFIKSRIKGGGGSHTKREGEREIHTEGERARGERKRERER